MMTQLGLHLPRSSHHIQSYYFRLNNVFLQTPPQSKQGKEIKRFSSESRSGRLLFYRKRGRGFKFALRILWKEVGGTQWVVPAAPVTSVYPGRTRVTAWEPGPTSTLNPNLSYCCLNLTVRESGPQGPWMCGDHGCAAQHVSHTPRQPQCGGRALAGMLLSGKSQEASEPESDGSMLGTPLGMTSSWG